MKKNKSVRSAIIDVVNYYNFFNYAPTFGEIYQFLSIKTTKKALQSELTQLVHLKMLIEIENPKIQNARYTIPSQRILEESILGKRLLSKSKLQYIQEYIDILVGVSAIRLVGISGSVAMRYSDRSDDIDVFIISAGNRMWTARFISVFIAYLMGLKRPRNTKEAPDKVCLNLFFDESEMSVPTYKRNLYTAHEVLQMKPLIVKGDIYEKFLKANDWVFEYFPNAKINKSSVKAQQALHPWGVMGNIVESCLKKIQLFIINRHQTTEIVTPTQLWFFPEDFEKKLRKKGLLD